jgi:hypothetical protein
MKKIDIMIFIFTLLNLLICSHELYNMNRPKHKVKLTIVMDSIEYRLQVDNNVTAGELYDKLKTN